MLAGERAKRMLCKMTSEKEFPECNGQQDEAEENDATEEEMTRERTTRRGRPRGGTKVAARIGERLRSEIGRGGRPRVGDG